MPTKNERSAVTLNDRDHREAKVKVRDKFYDKQCNDLYVRRRRPLQVPLTDLAIELLKEAAKRFHNSAFLFTADGDKPLVVEMNTDQHQVNEEAVSQRDRASAAIVILSPREKQLLRRLAKGKTDCRIAVEIGGAHRQIGLQRQRLIARLGIRSRAQLVTMADQLAPWPEHRDGRR